MLPNMKRNSVVSLFLKINPGSLNEGDQIDRGAVPELETANPIPLDPMTIFILEADPDRNPFPLGRTALIMPVEPVAAILDELHAARIADMPLDPVETGELQGVALHQRIIRRHT